MTRLGAKMSYEEASEEVGRLWNVTLSKSAVRDITMRLGKAYQAVAEAESERVLSEAPEVTAEMKQAAVSVDGSFIHLTNGEWREVKMMTVGQFESKWHAKEKRYQPHTSDLSYFARMENATSFATSSIGEWHRRGCEQAEKIVAINDGAVWIQGFIDYHAPKATRILDFAHATGYLANVGHAIHPDDSDAFSSWFGQARHQLLRCPSAQILNKLAFLQRKHDGSKTGATIVEALGYLQRREDQIDYPHFRRCGFPIGSGTVESGHKLVVQRRMKQAGMRWDENSVNPMLALRNAICSKRWDESWESASTQRRGQIFQDRIQTCTSPQCSISPPVTLESVRVAEVECTPPPSSTSSNNPNSDHPWRKGIWPDPRFP